MPVPDSSPSSNASNTYLFVPIALFFVLLIIVVLRNPDLVTNAGLGSAIIVVAPLILATYSVMAIAMAGRVSVDLSVGPLIGFINVTLVQLYRLGFIHSPGAFFVYAVCAGILYQLLVALIVIFVRVQPIIVALSGYLALSGIDLVILKRPGGTVPDWMSTWGAGTSIISPVTLVVVLSTIGWLLFTRTAFYGHLRLMGSDERAAYVSGVRIGIVRLGAHAIGGIYAGLAAITYTSLISSGDPTQGTTYTLIAVTALVLGGASLTGGRGGVFGSLLGALNIYLITAVLATFDFGAVQGFVTDLSYGVILVISLLLTLALPFVRRLVGNLSPLLFFVLLSLITVGVINYTVYRLPTASAGSSQIAGAVKATVKATPKKSEAIAAERRDEGRFIFEKAVGPRMEASKLRGGNAYALPEEIALAGIILLSLVAILRAVVAQVEAQRASLAPLVYLIVVAVVLLGFFFLANPHEAASLLGVPSAHAPQHAPGTVGPR